MKHVSIIMILKQSSRAVSGVKLARNIISNIEENEFKDAIQAWIIRMNKCIDAKGCYFEQV